MNGKKYAIGLALSGGGIRGFAHVGALRALQDAGIKPDIITGVSAGSVVASCYAAGMTADDIYNTFSDVNMCDFLQVDISKSGFLKLDKFGDFLRDVLPVQRIEDLPLPTIIAATDIDEQTEAPFTEGELVPRILASCSIPLVFSPITIDDRHYVDGGVLHNLPSFYLRDICDTVIGINVSPSKLGKVQLNMRALAYRTYKIMTQRNVKADKALCDILVDITAIQHFGTFELSQSARIARTAYFETMRVLKNSDLTDIIKS